ncbi:Peroxiredoxin [Desulfocurvibacter africanus PCS]|uniref:Peroxiredoxin n=1 Tax=Desulfocurvibacter africanus PCS TaxID=1262666 RepID=M5PUZ7_DESAF|nr:TlpA disulfide reductase family protein [Desulfocurvibacter africanus]EMG38162.1 Peroxiredoxin [Desulfocurvibacter africanus PCS]
MTNRYMRAAPGLLAIFACLTGLAGLACLVCMVGTATAAGLPAEGDRLPDFSMDSPGDPASATDLGIAADAPFTLAQLQSELVLLEIIGVYCPQCHRQLPGFNSLAAKLKRAGLKGRVAMLGLAAGGTPQETAYLRAKGGYAYPVAPDPDYRVHKILGEPLTPFTLLVDKTGTVRFAHLGVIEDVDALFARIRDLLR